MCEFLSAIVLKNGDVLYNPYTDHHEDLISLHNLRDKRGDEFARVEFKPDDALQLAEPDKYKLTIDQERTPDWFSGDMQTKVADKLRGIVSRMIVRDEKICLIGGCHILADGAKLQFIKAARVIVMLGTSRVGEMRESSNVGEMRESSKVGVMLESSNVGEMRESSKVGVMLESSNVGEMRESSNVGVMLESSNVGEMLESSKVGAMRESSNVGNDKRDQK